MKCSNSQKRIVLKSKLKSNDTEAIEDSIDLICENTTRYDKNIADYTCTPPCEKPKNLAEERGIVHNWKNAMVKPEVGDAVIYSCTNGSQIVSKLDFAGAIANAQMDELEIICTMSGKYDKSIGLY